nr:reverse transcriptase domain-containing protein [Tanacetum cinerariifolium]
MGQEPTTSYSEPERFIHRANKKKKKRRIPFIPVENRIPKVNYPPFENLFEALVVCYPFIDLPFPMADDQPMWGNNRAVALALGATIVAVDLGYNFTVKGHHPSMIKDRQFNGRARADPHKHIAEFVKICGIFRYGTTNADAIKLKLFPSSLAGDAKDVTIVEVLTHRRSVTTSRWEVLKMKKQTMPIEVIEEEDIEEPLRLFDQCSTRPTGSLSSNTQTNPKPSSMNDKPYSPPFAWNEYVNAVFTQSGLKYDLSVNPNAKATVIHDYSDDEVGEAKKEAESSSSKQTKSDPTPLKAYKPKISYHQRLRKEKMEERYAKLLGFHFK